MCPTVEPNAPECLRQREQWQWIARVNGSVTSKRTPPQRQLPPTVSAMAPVYVGCGCAASAHGQAGTRCARRRRRDRLLGDPLPQVQRLAVTGAFFRCLWALPFLWPLAIWEDRPARRASRWSLRRAAWVAGAFFAADLILWHYSIEYVGAGLATVLGNTQVVLVGLLAWALFRERPSSSSLLAIPVAMVGIMLISGVLENGAYGSNPRLRRDFRRADGNCVLGLPARDAARIGRARASGGAALRRDGRERDLSSSRSGSSSATSTSRRRSRRPAGSILLALSSQVAGLAPDHGLARPAADGAHVGAVDTPAAARRHLRGAARSTSGPLRSSSSARRRSSPGS